MIKLTLSCLNTGLATPRKRPIKEIEYDFTIHEFLLRNMFVWVFELWKINVVLTDHCQIRRLHMSPEL